MANLPISGLTASAANLTATDVMPVVQTTGVGPVKMSGLQLAGGLLGSTALTGGPAVTADSPLLDLSQTWNAAGVTFTGLRFNAAGTSDANSAAGSLLLDLEVGGATKFSVNKAGEVATGLRVYPTSQTNISLLFGNGSVAVERKDTAATQFFVSATSRLAALGATATLGWSSVADSAGSTADLFLRRAAAATLQLGASDAAAPIAQTLQVQSVVAGTTNTAGANFTINGSRGTGTGAGGSIIFQVAPAGASGTAQNAYATALTIGKISGNEVGTYAYAQNGTNWLFVGGDGNSAPGIYTSTGFLSIRTGQYTNKVNINGSGLHTANAADVISFNGGYNSPTTTGDVILARDAANTLALRNGANAQTFNIYETYTDASNYSRLAISYDSGSSSFRIAPQAAGTGSPRNITLAPANGSLNITASSVVLDGNRQIRWGTTPVTYISPRDNTANDINFGLNAAAPLACTIGGCGGRSGADTDTAGANFTVRGGLGTGTGVGGNLQFAVGLPGAVSGNASNAAVNIAYFAGASGHMLWNTDNQYDIGASGANRPRSAYIGTSVVSGSLVVTSRGQLTSGGTSDGQLRLTNTANNGFDRLQFGGGTTSFPALKRSAATLQVRLADDSGFATIDGQIQMEGTAPASATATGTAGDLRYDSGYIYVCTATDTWKRVAIATWP